MAANRVTKYRPSLTLVQMQHITAMCKMEQPISNLSMEVVATLSTYIAKAENNAVSPAYATSPKQSLEQSLGMGSPASGTFMFQGEVYTDKEEYWAACYKVYTLNPTSLSLIEIGAAKEHMYLEGLMSNVEIADFEKESFGLK